MSAAEAIITGVGAGASGAALVASGLSVRHRWRAHVQRRELRVALFRLVRLDYWISLSARHLDTRLEEGVGWAGVDVWPERLTGGLTYLTGIANELERTGARLRSIDDADTAVGRMRDDVEELCELLGDAALRYLTGTMSTYRTSEGAAVPMSASGRELTPTLAESDVVMQESARRRAAWLFRSCLFRTDEQLGERYACQWLIRRWEREQLEPAVIRGVVPAPMDWLDDLPAPD